MKKTLFAFLCVMLLLLLCCSACGGDDQPLLDSADAAAETGGLIPPCPENGETVAEIDGAAYVYDPLYLFQWTNENREEMNADSVRFALMMELFVLEAEKAGITVPDADVDQYLEDRKGTLDRLIAQRDEMIAAGEGVVSEEMIDTASLSVELYEENFNAVLEGEGIDADTYWENQREYVYKYLLAMAYSKGLMDQCNAECGAVPENAAGSYSYTTGDSSETMVFSDPYAPVLGSAEAYDLYMTKVDELFEQYGVVITIE